MRKAEASGDVPCRLTAVRDRRDSLRTYSSGWASSSHRAHARTKATVALLVAIVLGCTGALWFYFRSQVSELADSIAVTGVIEPLVVIPQGDESMRILAGHRRAAAAMAAGIEAVPCLVRPDLAGADDEQLAAALAENIQRQALAPQEEARAYAQLSAFPGCWSAGRIARATGRDELSVRRSIEASGLAPELQPAAISGQLSLEDAARVASF